MITEDQLEQLSLDWFKFIGYDYACGYDIAPDGIAPERTDYLQILLLDRLVPALGKNNPQIPSNTLDQVAHQIAKSETPVLIKNNKQFNEAAFKVDNKGEVIYYRPYHIIPQEEKQTHD